MALTIFCVYGIGPKELNLIEQFFDNIDKAAKSLHMMSKATFATRIPF